MGARGILRDKIKELAVSGDTLVYLPFGPGRSGEICTFHRTGGPVTCSRGVSDSVLGGLTADGPVLYGVASSSTRQNIARIDHERRTVVELPSFADDAWLDAVSFGPAGVCAVIGRHGQSPAVPALALVHVPRAGGAPVTLVPFGQVHLREVACDATDAYFVGDLGLSRVSLRGGPPEGLGTPAYRLALGPRHVYAAGPGGILRVPKGSTSAELIAEVPPRWDRDEPVTAMRSFAGGVVWQDRRAQEPFALRWCRDDHACETLFESDERIELVAAEDGVVYWTRRDGSQLFAARGPAWLHLVDDAP